MQCGGQQFLGKERGNPVWSVSLDLLIGSIRRTDDTWNVLPSTGGTGESEKFRQTTLGHRSPRKSKHVKLWNQMVQRQPRRSTERASWGHIHTEVGKPSSVPPESLVAWSKTRNITLPSSEVLGIGRGQASRIWHFYPKLWAECASGPIHRRVTLTPEQLSYVP